jgi:protein tyrosine phosphatase (PTP) superfamily phosphohydrolase (DUF442 family)
MKTGQIKDFKGVDILYQIGNIYSAGQPTLEGIRELKEQGFKRVINIRNEGEMDFSEEEALCQELGLEYVHLPVIDNGEFIFENVKKLNDLLSDDKEFVHCGTANRVGGWAITYLVDKKGMDFDAAVEVCQNNGMRAAQLIDMAQDYLDD